MVGGLVCVRADERIRRHRRRTRLVRGFLAGQIFGQPPVHDLHFAERSDHHVRRLQVAVDDAPAVSEADRLAYLREGLQQPRPVGGHHLGGQSLPGDQFQCQERGAVGERAEGVDGRDAGVRQPGGDLRLADEPVGRGTGQQHLDGDIAVKTEVVGGEDLAHAAAGDFTEHAVAWDCRQVVTGSRGRGHRNVGTGPRSVRAGRAMGGVRLEKRVGRVGRIGGSRRDVCGHVLVVGFVHRRSSSFWTRAIH